MKTTKHLILAVALCLCSAFNAEAAYNGTPVTPKKISSGEYAGWYAISNAEELYGFAELVNGYNYFKGINGVLTADIVVNENVLKADGTLNGTPTYSWTPIGTTQAPFKGMFDGQEHIISGLYFCNNDGGYPYGGLFGSVVGDDGNKPKILNVGVVDSYFKGNGSMGGICGAGRSFVHIENCFNTSSIVGNGESVGGICGGLINSSSIDNCYNTGKVIGSGCCVGGICGYIFSTDITDCRNTGMVTGGSYGVGGICGINGNPQYSEITNCYYLAGCAIDGDNVVQYGVGNEVQGQTTADVSGKTFSHMSYNGTPVTPKKINSSNYTTYGFTSTNYSAYNGWYAISTAEELYGFAALVNNNNDHEKINGVITADIVVNENVLNTDGTLNGTPTHSWTPIGTYENKFAGKFDGQGHTISGLYFSNTTNRNYPSGGNYAGLFGYVSNLSCIVSNVGIVDSYIKGCLDVGSICGCADSYSTITNCYNTGAVMGNSHVSGICGKAIDYSTITNCYNTGAVMGSNYNIGGICGLNNSSTITNCYNTGTIKGSSYYVGGICGRNSSSTITNCYYLPGCAKDGNNVVQYGIGNGTKGQTTADVSGKTTPATTEEFASGKIAFLLNGSVSEGDLAWYQSLFSDATPVLDPSHNRVTGYVDEVDNVITVSGDLVIASDYEITEIKTLVIEENSSITIAEGAKLINNGTITNNGTFTNDGTLSLTGTISGNELEGTGNFIYTNLSENDVETATNGYSYKGTAYTLETGLSDIVKARTICGKQFIFDATGYTVSYEININVGNNAKIIWTGSSTVEKTFTITPNTNVVVTITGNSNTVAYNTGEQSISGYIVDIEDATSVYTENDFTFSGSAVASGTTIGTYAMELSADDFSNTNANFAEVQFVVTDGVLTINKAENAPDMPTTIETYYINTNRVALPDNWQWVENIALEKGENSATAEYIGEDADNYENVSIEVVVTRTACPHNEGYTTINTAEPSCTEEGYTGDHLCNICNEIFEQGESIAALGHTEAIDAAIAATCTAAGKTEGKHCSVCNAVLVAQEEIAALGHDFKDYVYNNDATTAADGTKTATCERGCGATDTKLAEGTKLPETPEKGTAVVDDAANAVNIYAYGNTIVVENATDEIFVYDTMGKLVARGINIERITVKTSGIYIVKTGGTVKRVMVND